MKLHLSNKKKVLTASVITLEAASVSMGKTQRRFICQHFRHEKRLYERRDWPSWFIFLSESHIKACYKSTKGPFCELCVHHVTRPAHVSRECEQHRSTDDGWPRLNFRPSFSFTSLSGCNDTILESLKASFQHDNTPLHVNRLERRLLLESLFLWARIQIIALVLARRCGGDFCYNYGPLLIDDSVAYVHARTMMT
jgi:hypothetical protein